MPDVTLAAETGRTLGSRSSNRLRSEGKIPGVLYGHGMEPIALAVNAREFRAALHGEAGSNTLLSLEVDGKKHLALARQMQKHPVRNTVVHIDFQAVSRSEIMSVDVPVHLVGEALQVTRNDGVVSQENFTLTISATPSKIPSSIDIDISNMQIGDTIRVSDLVLPEGVTTDLDPEESVVVAQGAQVTALSDEEEALEAAESEGAAAETAVTDAGSGGTDASGDSDGGDGDKAEG